MSRGFKRLNGQKGVGNMQRKLLMVSLAGAVLLAVTACSATTRELMSEEQQNGAHFASWQHMEYSLFRATPEQTTKEDLVAAQKEKWWGEPVKVAPPK